MTKLQKILVIDPSKVVRASLTKRLKGHFTVCEDVDGESAWQTLVLDSSISAVISASLLSRLDGLGLVERMRENQLCRLSQMPFFMIASDSLSSVERQRAIDIGVSDFVAKGMAAHEMEVLVSGLIERVSETYKGQKQIGILPMPSVPVSCEPEAAYTGAQSDVGVGDILAKVDGLAAADEAAPVVCVVPCRKAVGERLDELVPGVGEGRPVGVLVFGLDGFAALVSRHGEQVAEKVVLKISGLLANKIKSDDSIGEVAPGRIAVVAAQADQANCNGFAMRICKALAAAKLTVRGERVSVTLSVGVATMPEDGRAMSGAELLQLANGRLDTAIHDGGNRVVSAGKGANKAGIGQEEFLKRLHSLVAATSPDVITPCLGAVGQEIMPILKQLEQAFNFGLPIDSMDKRLRARARSERMIR